MRPTLLREWFVLTIALAAAVWAIGAGQWLARLDYAAYDLASLTWRRAASAEIVIIEIDDASLGEIGRWPWSRAIHATALARIAAGQPAAVGLDLILAEPDTEQPGVDALLARAIASVPVVLPVLIEGPAGRLREVHPIPEFERAAKAIGHIDAELDADGIVRRVFLMQGLDQASRPHFALAIAQLARPGAINCIPGQRRFNLRPATGLFVRDHRFAIPFVGPPGSFTRISYAAVLRGEIPPERFRDRIVLVGATAAGLGDAYPTSVSAESVAMPGIEINANVIDALLHGHAISEATPLTQAALASAIVVLLLAIYLVLSSRGALIASVMLAFALLIGSVVIFRIYGYWFSPALAVCGVIAAYPLWSWRRLEAAGRYLTQEIRQSSDELAVSRGELESPLIKERALRWADRFGLHLDEARQAAEALRRSRRVFAQSLTGLPMAVVVCDPRGEVLLANPPARDLLPLASGLAPPAPAPSNPNRHIAEVLGLAAHGGPIPQWRDRNASTIMLLIPTRFE